MNPTAFSIMEFDIRWYSILMGILRKSKKNGIVFFTYIGLYSIGRFIIEGMRTDSLMLGNIRVAQLVSLSGILIWIIFIFLIYYKKSNKMERI